MRYYACEDKDGNPLGYVNAYNKAEANIKGKVKYPDFHRCYVFNGVF